MAKQMSEHEVITYLTASAIPFSDLQDRLREDAEDLRLDPVFDIDDIVTPRPSLGYEGAGIPHVVVKLMRLKRNRSGFGTAAYGKMCDMLVASVNGSGSTTTYWVESNCYKAWNPATHGVNYDSRADAAQKDLDTVLAAKAARDVPAEVAAVDAAPEALAPQDWGVS